MATVSDTIQSIVINPNGTIYIEQRGEIVSQPQRWFPEGYAASIFEIRAVPTDIQGPGAIVTNPIINWTTISTITKIVTSFDSVDSAKEWTYPIDISIRRKSLPSDLVKGTITLVNTIQLLDQDIARPDITWLNSGYGESGNIDMGGTGFASALVEILLDPNGTVKLRGNYPFREQTLGTWGNSEVVASGIEVRITLLDSTNIGSGYFSNSAQNWTRVNVLRGASLEVSSQGMSYVQVLYEVRRVGDTVVSSKTMNWSVSLHDGTSGPQ